MSSMTCVIVMKYATFVQVSFHINTKLIFVLCSSNVVPLFKLLYIMTFLSIYRKLYKAQTLL